ncbi:Xaa-Pro dipeptidyl-peptidase [Secundilactobacillus kimchicus]|uniref:Xaa-Pro dipeptidyl-peptidase n=1 Tax=Secundilactobacillus kimchicus TaxID=528209 RepID=UPI0024A9B3A4|nr:Xaa-Pro dipeptidyl-peptidase [Secundilactobacillus kimchicus]
MRLNQFAITPTTLETEVRELKRIHFIDDQTSQLPPLAALIALLDQSFPEAQSAATKRNRRAGLMATTTLTVADLEAPATITPAIFANLYLQLLGFEPGEQFDLADPYAINHLVNLPRFTHDLTTIDLIHGWYQLLVTHTVMGQTYLDDLTSRGYFEPLVHDPTTPRPLFFNGKAQPVYDVTTLIREAVYVESPQDSDSDGQRDLLKVEITRPSETAAGIKVPVLYTASPYNQGTNDAAGDRLMHDVNVPLTEKRPTSGISETSSSTTPLPAARTITAPEEPASETLGNGFEYSLNDYFLARGFAVVYAAGIGTKDSDGLRTTGDPQETISTVAVIQWLTGTLPAFTDRQANHPTRAFWSTGNVAMTGRSYLGTLATAAATTGIDGLKTIISEAAISSWYDYYRENGLVVAPGGFPGEDTDVLALETFSRQQRAGEAHKIQEKWRTQLNRLTHDQDRETGNYNAFWDARNYRKNVAHIKADIVLVHGLNDWNVKPRQVERLWQALRDVPVTKKLILHQGPHIYINNFRSLDFTDMMNLWLSYKLYDVDNDADQLLPPVLIQDNAKPETWHPQTDWAAPETPLQTWYGQNGLLTQQAPTHATESRFNDQLSTQTFAHYIHNLPQWAHDLMTPTITPLTGHRLLLQSAPLNAAITMDGVPQLTVTVASTQPIGLLSARLVDYGLFKRLGRLPATLAGQAMDLGFHYRKEVLRDYQLAPTASPYQLISLGHLNLQNRQAPDVVQPIVPGQKMTVQLALQPTHYVLPAGHQLGLILYATDFEMTIRGNQPITYTIDMATTRLDLPILTK